MIAFFSRCTAGVVVVLAAFVCQAPALAAGYVLHPLPSLGGTSSRAMSINAQGVIVGSSATPDGVRHPVAWRSGNVQLLFAGAGEAWAINDHGTILHVNGNAATLLRPGHDPLSLPLEWYPDTLNQAGVMAGVVGEGNAALMTSNAWFGILGLPGSTFSRATGINDHREVVGYSRIVPDNEPTLWRDGQILQLPVLGIGGVASALNNHGLIVGNCWEEANFIQPRAVRWDHLQPVALPAPPPSWAVAVNDAGEIVGSSTPVAGQPTHAVLWTLAGMTDLNDYVDPALKQAGWVLVAAYAINASGWIVGEMDNTASQEKRAYVLTR